MFDGPDGDEQLLREIETVAGPEMRATAAVDPLVRLAIERRLAPVLRTMSKNLRTDLKHWEDEEVARLLSWAMLSGQRERRLHVPFEDVRALRTHGVRPGCFGSAVKMLLIIGRWEIASLARARAVSKWPRAAADADVPKVLAEIYDDPRYAPFRLELLRSLQRGSEAFKRRFLDELDALEDRGVEVRAAIASLLFGDGVGEAVFAADLARTFWTSDGAVREDLLLHPKDEDLGFLRPSLRRCIKLVHDLLLEHRGEVHRAREYTVIPQFPPEAVEEIETALNRPAVAVESVGLPEELAGEADEVGPHHVRVFAVPVRLHGDRGSIEERTLIHRLGDRLRVGTWRVTSAVRTVPPVEGATRTLSAWQPAFPDCVRPWREVIDEVRANKPEARKASLEFAMRERFCDYPGDWMLDLESIAKLDPNTRLRAPEFLLDVLRHTIALPRSEQMSRRPVYAAAMQTLARISDATRAAEVLEAMTSEKLEARQCTWKRFPRAIEILRGTATRSACTCAIGRSGDRKDHTDLVVEQRDMTGEWGTVYEERFDCRCRTCDATWRVIESVDWGRRSIRWSQTGAPSAGPK